MTDPEPSKEGSQLRWTGPFKVRSVWVPPVIVVTILIVAMTLVYFGSVVNPTGHLHGLPVAVVNQDAGTDTGGQHVNFGEQIASGLTGSSAVSSRLALRPSTLAHAKGQMDIAKEYTAVVIPSGFTNNLLAIAGVSRATAKPAVELLTNPRASTLAVSLATGVLQPALSRASAAIGQKLKPLGSAHPGRAAPSPVLTDPITVSVVPYRPLPSHSALGLSAFYIALLTTFCGFLGAVIVGTSIDAVLGYATTEIGPMWRQRQPVPISRVQTLISKWVMAAVLTVILTGLMLFTAVVILGMKSPDFVSLWLLCWFAAMVVAIGTLAIGLVFWVGAGLLVTTWYDRKRLYRMPPDLMRYIDRAVAAYRRDQAALPDQPERAAAAQGSADETS